MSGAKTTETRPAPTLAPARGLRLQRASCACGKPIVEGGECSSCRKSRLQRSGHGPVPEAVPSSVQQVLRSPGAPLDSATRADMEARFGHDFSQVRVHAGSAAAESARDVHAHAYTVGQDVVFGQNNYAPGTPAGRQLLAHELAHTVQQSGLQRSADGIAMDQGPEYHRLERDAETASNAALQGTPVSLAPAASRPTLSRAPKKPAPASPGKKKKGTKVTTEFGNHVVTPSDTFDGGTAGNVEEYEVNVLYVPGEKGKVSFDEYARIQGGKLESTVGFNGSGRARTALWQTRPSTDDLRKLWLEKVGWSADARDDLWKRSGGDAEFPKVGGSTCQMDHSIELQLGGDNTPANIQPLNAGPNQGSGRDINRQLTQLVNAIRDDAALSDADTAQFKLRFAKAESRGAMEGAPSGCPPKKPTCLSVEHCAKNLKVSKDEKGNVSVARDDYPISVGGGTPRQLKVPVTFKTVKDEKVPIEGDSLNGGLATLLPGLLLTQLTRKGAGKAAREQVHARIDTRPETRLPLSLDAKAPPVALDVGAGGVLKLSPADKKGGMAFTYKYLSPGRITELAVNEAGDLEWKGIITPGVPFLGELGVAYAKGTLLVTKGLDEAALKKRKVLGMQVTKAQLELLLAPEFKPRGVVELRMGPEAKPLATVSLSVEADDVGLVARGKLKVRIPKMETAESDVVYKGGGGRNEWSVAIHIKSEAIKLGGGFTVTGELTGSIDKERIDFDGKLDVGMPGDNSAQLGLKRGPGGAWLLTGVGEFRIPKVDRVRATVSYDIEKELLVATVGTKTGFTFRPLDLKATLENLTVTLNKGRFSATGTGRVDFKKGKAEGFAIITLLPTGKFTGTGGLTYALTPNVSITGTVTLDEKEKLRVTGLLSFKKLTLLDAIGAKRTLLDVEYGIPIPGASIGGIGVKAVIGAKVETDFSLGPVTIEPLVFEAGFDPLEADPDLDLAVWGQVNVPASASLSATISGGVKIDAFIAEVGGKLSLTGTISLEGGAKIPFKARYAKKKLKAELTAEVQLGLLLAIALSATVWAKAGIGWLSVKTEKTWELARRKVDTGLKFGLKAPLSYDSDTGVKMPSLDRVELIKPDFSEENLKRVASEIFGGARSSEREV